MSIGKRILAIALLLSAGVFLNAASNGTNEELLTLSEHPLQSELEEVTNLRLHLKDGDFRIVGVDSGDITIRTDGKNIAEAKRMRVRLKRSGNSLDLTFFNVPKNDFQVTIAIPRETALFARMRGGDLSVDGVAGDKDLALVGGDLSIEVPDPGQYGPVDLSVKFGDVSGSQFGNPKGWIGNRVKQNGIGKYRLHARVFAGDLMLKP